MEFIFPSNIENFAEIREIPDFLQQIQEQNSLIGSNIVYRCAKRKEIYIYCRCKYKKCPSYLNYRKNGESFRLVKYNNNHNHGQNEVRKNQYSLIENQLNQLPITISTSSAKHHICQKYRISQRCYYYLNQKIRNKKMSFKELTTFFDSKSFEVQTDPFYYGMNELPDLMIVVSPLMKENFQRFGHWVGFDFTFNLIQQVKDNRQPWRVGVFVGISSSRKIVPFGLVICNEQNSNRFYSIFKTFGQIMNKMPEIIVTDEDKATGSALKTLGEQREFNGHHLLDCFHILRNVKKNLVNKECFHFFNQLIRQKSKDNFKRIVNEAYETMESEGDINLLKRFLENAHKYCFCQTPNALFGFMPNTTSNQKIHDLIKSIIPYSKPFTVVAKKIMHYLQDLGLKCYQYQLQKNKLETTFFYPPLKQIRYTVCKSIFKEIVLEFSKSIHHEVRSVSERFKIIVEGFKQYEVNEREGKWLCSCNYLQKTGIPCSHLLKIVLFQKLRVADYVNSRWKIEMELGSQIRKKYIYQRKTRRYKK